MKNDDFGDRMKAYEATETKRKFTPMLPIIARIDGRSFSKFTKHFDKPFDNRLTSAMQDTCVMLVEATNASIGYVQSDEITLIFYSDDYDKPIFFDGRVQKMVSVLAGMATAYFIRNLDRYSKQNYRETTSYSAYPHFDARVWQVPTKTEAAKLAGYSDAANEGSKMTNPKHYPLVCAYTSNLRDEVREKYGISYEGHLA